MQLTKCTDLCLRLHQKQCSAGRRPVCRKWLQVGFTVHSSYILPSDPWILLLSVCRGVCIMMLGLLAEVKKLCAHPAAVVLFVTWLKFPWACSGILAYNTFQNNVAKQQGGAIATFADATLTISSSQFISNGLFSCFPPPQVSTVASAHPVSRCRLHYLSRSAAASASKDDDII